VRTGKRKLARDAAAALTLAALVGCSGGDGPGAEQVLRFSAIPDDNTTELKEKFDPVASYLSEKLGVQVEYVPSTDYGASVEMFKNGDIHLAWFGGLTGVQARQAVQGAHAIAQGVEDPDYFSYFVAHESTGLERTQDFPHEIAKLKFTFGSTMSTSGRLMPEHFIRKFTGKAPDEFFEHDYGYSGSHNKAAEQVHRGAYEAGVLNYKVYESMVADGKIDPEVCRVIWKTPSYADYNFTAHPELETLFGAGFTAKLQAALVELKDERLLAAFKRSGLIEAEDREFDDILSVARSLNLAR
jgi:phosphonate transport system substrate-binding protein